MYKLSAKHAQAFLNEPNKYRALFELSDHLEDTMDRDDRNEAIMIRHAINAATQLKFAMENDRTGESTKLFNSHFQHLWKIIVKYCKECATNWTVEITEILQRRVQICAESESDAITAVKDFYHSGTIELNYDNLMDTTFNIVEE